jgi:hypothetical protein
VGTQRITESLHPLKSCAEATAIQTLTRPLDIPQIREAFRVRRVHRRFPAPARPALPEFRAIFWSIKAGGGKDLAGDFHDR